MEPIRLQLPVNFNVHGVNAFLFTQPEPVLVDTGIKSEESWEALQLGLAEHNLTVNDLSRVIVTHPHIDHFGGAARILAHSDADLWVCDLGAPWLIDTAGMWQKRLAYYRDDFLPHVGMDEASANMVLTVMGAMAEMSEAVPADRLHTFPPDGRLQMGGLTWQSIFVPGHNSAQTCFYQPETKLLLSADHLLETTPTPVVERPLPNQPRTPALPLFMDSMQTIRALDIDAVYPGHGRPFGKKYNLDHLPIIDKQCGRIQKRKADTLRHIQAGSHTPNQLVDKLYAHRSPQVRFAGLWMLIGYLDLLLAEDAIRQETVDGVWHYYSRE
jgi:glyoxylase-like metal-dependent hydrolase (beta-lactamase superfamily II)